MADEKKDVVVPEKFKSLVSEIEKMSVLDLAELVKMVDLGQVSVTAGRQVLGIMFQKGGDPSNIVQDEGLAQVSDETALEQSVDKVIMENQKAVEDYRGGKQQSFGFLVGQVMKELRGSGSPKVINEILRKKLT